MEDVLIFSSIQDEIENKWNKKKGILQLKRGQWEGDIYAWPNGCWYYGETKNTYADGLGCFYDIDYNDDYCRYVGDFVNGKYEGFGKYRHFNGEYYTGYWKNNYRHGEGTIIYENGDIYSGSWKDGYRQGIGIYKYNKPKLGVKGFKAKWKLDSIDYYIELLQ